MQERVRTLDEVDGYLAFAYLDVLPFDEASWQKVMVKGVDAAKTVLDAAADGFASYPWQPADIRTVVEAAAVAAGLVNAEGRPQLAKAQAPVRVAAMGSTVGLPLFEALTHLGRERTLARIGAARARLP